MGAISSTTTPHRFEEKLGSVDVELTVAELSEINAAPKGNARGCIHPELNDREEAVGLVVREKSELSSGRQSFAEGDGAHPCDLVTGSGC